jgi:hypothetical protein
VRHLRWPQIRRRMTAQHPHSAHAAARRPCHQRGPRCRRTRRCLRGRHPRPAHHRRRPCRSTTNPAPPPPAPRPPCCCWRRRAPAMRLPPPSRQPCRPLGFERSQRRVPPRRRPHGDRARATGVRLRPMPPHAETPRRSTAPPASCRPRCSVQRLCASTLRWLACRPARPRALNPNPGPRCRCRRPHHHHRCRSAPCRPARQPPRCEPA